MLLYAFLAFVLVLMIIALGVRKDAGQLDQVLQADLQALDRCYEDFAQEKLSHFLIQLPSGDYLLQREALWEAVLAAMAPPFEQLKRHLQTTYLKDLPLEHTSPYFPQLPELCRHYLRLDKRPSNLQALEQANQALDQALALGLRLDLRLRLADYKIDEV